MCGNVLAASVVTQSTIVLGDLLGRDASEHIIGSVENRGLFPVVSSGLVA